MRILALETSGLTGSVATWLSDDHSGPRQWCLPGGTKSASSLAPTVELALAETGWAAREIDLIAVTSGPGSFTSLRVGVVTAKAMAYGVGCPVIGVNSLEVIARQAVPQPTATLLAVMDAQRGEFFVSAWQVSGEQNFRKFVECRSTAILSAETLLSQLNAGDSIIGPGLASLLPRLPGTVHIVDAALWQPQASTVAQLGFELYSGECDRASSDPFALVPTYYRRTAAEEQWERRANLTP